jgi:hypothetical protein
VAASVLIAKLLGPILLVAAVTMLANPKDILEIAREFLNSRALVYLAGVLAMLGGLAIVINHNIWVADWPVLITLFGWASLLGGIARIALPSVVKSVGGAMIEHPAAVRAIGAVWAVVGAFLIYKGYLS